MSDRHFRYPIGAVLLALLAGVFVVDDGLREPVLAPLILAALGIMALQELLAMYATSLPGPLRAAALAAGTGMLAAAPLLSLAGGLQAGPAVVSLCGLLGGLLLLGLAVLARHWHGGDLKEELPALGLALMGLAAVAVPLALLQDLVLRLPRPLGIRWLLVVVLVAKLNDIGAYITGSNLPAHRKHALCPGISPGKSVEGAAGGLLLALAGAFALHRLLPPFSESLPLAGFLLVAAALGVAAQLGDLFASAVKRAAGTKDSGSLLPAFGGVLDLIDSLIFSGPAGAVLGLVLLV